MKFNFYSLILKETEHLIEVWLKGIISEKRFYKKVTFFMLKKWIFFFLEYQIILNLKIEYYDHNFNHY